MDSTGIPKFSIEFTFVNLPVIDVLISIILSGMKNELITHYRVHKLTLKVSFWFALYNRYYLDNKHMR